MKAKEKMEVALRLLTERTWSLLSDYSVSINHIKFDWENLHVDYYTLRFFPNNGKFFTEESVLTILSTTQAFKGRCIIKQMHGSPVIQATLEDDRA